MSSQLDCTKTSKHKKSSHEPNPAISIGFVDEQAGLFGSEKEISISPAPAAPVKFTVWVAPVTPVLGVKVPTFEDNW